jgi:hypothetical protein
MNETIQDHLTRYYEVDEVEVIRVAVTQEQVDALGLPTIPPDDREELDKLHKDKNRFSFMLRHGLYHRDSDSRQIVYHEDKLFSIQLETMEEENALAWFREFLNDTVDSYFDQDVYDKVMKEANGKKTKNKIDKSVKIIAEDLLKAARRKERGKRRLD